MGIVLGNEWCFCFSWSYARTRTYYRDFMFFAVTSVTARDGNVRCFAEKVPCFDENKPSFYVKWPVVLCKMTCRFMENNPSFGLCRGINFDYLLKVGVSSLFSVWLQWDCDTCDSKKSKLQCVCVRAHAREDGFWSLNNTFHCIFQTYGDILRLRLVVCIGYVMNLWNWESAVGVNLLTLFVKKEFLYKFLKGLSDDTSFLFGEEQRIG